MDGVAEVEQVTAAERLFLSTRGYRFEPVPVVQPADPGFPDPADIPDF